MIFSRFFSPSHSSNDPDTRLKAIAKLSPDSPNERRILHELAFNDANHNVSLAALEKLNSFVLWLKMSQIAKDVKLLNAAQARVECALIDGHADISLREIKEYLLKTAPTEQLMKCLPLMTELHQDADFCLAVLSKVSRSSFTQQFIIATPEQSLKRVIIEQSQDTDMLQRLLRKTSDKALQSVLSERIAVLTELAEKPEKLTREVTLVLSKLMATLDKADYLQIRDSQQLLNEQYAALSSQFDCLDSEARDAFNSKLQALNTRINALLARLKPVYEAEQQAARHEQAKATSAQAVAEVKRLHKQLQGEQLLSLTLGEVSVFQQAVEAAERALAELQQFEAPAEQIESMLESYRSMWDRLPELQRQVTAAQSQLQSWEALLKVDDAEWQLDSLKQEWQQRVADMVVVPAFLLNRWQQLFEQFKVIHQQRQSSQQRHLKHCRKHINIINNLVEQGKYRAAMTRFQRLEADYQSLPQDTQALLEKRFEQTREQIARLEGWQIYLAAPRKPELIEQAEALLNEKQDDMPARARSIKYLRQQWQSLGESHNAQDNELNQRFDALLEQAFEPCRRYYAQLEQQNDAAAEQRQQLIAQMLALPDTELTMAERYQQFEALKKQWQQASQTDAERYRQLRDEWDTACATVLDTIVPWLQENRQAKQTLIDEVKALASQDDMDFARQQAKTYQSQWKSIGPAGKRYESKLWFAFKQANDGIFSKVKSAQAQQKAEQSAAAQQWREQLNLVAQAVNEATQADSDIQQQLSECAAALQQVADNRMQKSLQRELDALQAEFSEQVNARLQQQLMEELTDCLQQLFNGATMSSWQASTATRLPAAWFKGNEITSVEDWQKNLVTLEVLAQLDSPEAEGSLRSTIQLQLMQSKLNGEQLPSASHLIAALLASNTVLAELDASMFRGRLLDVCASFILTQE
ncbi:DUF349 domain-containing protein [Alteromonas lipolytica]|uniref:DUF349 domain-containing protein n=1 Tax=Alteromonas lipolytica TaxID=1856405 RepID=A0A1E8FGZ7_9ALTE|nr:DUF349 domain-containing protein [Alteromonas lipolytica]OFI35016.1 hypothetical protein BFC17_15780 [Alteromonas lipolytica]GGF55921.1 hypothetical protein GCM10011338_05250 [Alteromonas lipolytica]